MQFNDNGLSTSGVMIRQTLNSRTAVIPPFHRTSHHTIAWSAYYTSLKDENVPSDCCITLTQLLPLFNDKAATLAMMKHGINILRSAIEFGQITGMVFDVPLFALAKFVRWKWPEMHGENKFIAMFGGLHIEMAMCRT